MQALSFLLPQFARKSRIRKSALIPLSDISTQKHQAPDMYRSLPESDKLRIHHLLSAFTEMVSRQNQ
jgi:hypothetical protein